MNDGLTDLLPYERQSALARDYYLRLATIVMIFAGALVIIATLLLVPTYVYLAMTTRVKEVQLANIQSSLSLSDEKELSARLASLTEQTNFLLALEKASSASATTREALAISRPGIALSGLSYTPAADTKSATLVISGTAATRDSLRRYQLALEEASFAEAADLPVSAYAKDSNINFAITVTLSP